MSAEKPAKRTPKTKAERKDEEGSGERRDKEKGKTTLSFCDVSN